MVVSLGFIKINCESCSWKKKQYCSSDAITGLPTQCPKCGSEKISIEKVSGIKGLFL